MKGPQPRHRERAVGAVVLLLCSAAALAAPEPRLKFGRLTTNQGLSNNWVLSVLRDSQGFLWVGTEDGLNRYDGRSFKIYRPSAAGDPHSLASRVAAVLLEDS